MNLEEVGWEDGGRWSWLKIMPSAVCDIDSAKFVGSAIPMLVLNCHFVFHFQGIVLFLHGLAPCGFIVVLASLLEYLLRL
jgi:hypothetical protein